MKKDLTKFEAGFHGRKDAMREKAKKAFGAELTAAKNARTPASYSAPGLTKMRKFKEGGHAAPRSKMHRLTKEQSDLHIPTRKKPAAVKTGTLMDCKMKAKGGKPKYGLGGALLGGLAGPLLNKIPKVGSTLATIAGIGGGFLPFKKGGKASTKRIRKADGGDVSGAQEPDLIANAKQRWADSHPNGATFKKGGKTKSKGDGMKKKCYASGGSVYEKQMVGEKPSKKRPHINYESEMRGEKPVHVRKKADGGKVDKFAMGGAAKVRKGQSTASGKPISRRRSVKMG